MSLQTALHTASLRSRPALRRLVPRIELPATEQLKLVETITGNLGAAFGTSTQTTPIDDKTSNGAKLKPRKQRLAKANALLGKLDAIAESIQGQFDSAKDIRELREERANRI